VTKTPGTIQQVTATVTDLFGNTVQGTVVTFTETGPGTFLNDGSQVTVTTDANGEARAQVTTLASEAGDQTITASLPTTNGVDECEKAAGDPPGSTAGNCSDVAVVTWQVSATCPGFAGDDRNQVIGTPGDDVLIGTNTADVICGLGGNDVLKGRDGKDIIKGGAGDDHMKGGDRRDHLKGGAGDDVMRAGGGNDSLKGGPGPDTARGGAGKDRCRSAVVKKSCER
jgi:Ca2+-binding RTX toxin-like protein